MIYGLLILFIGAVLCFSLISWLGRVNRVVDATFLKRLFYYHFLLTSAYYLYALFNPSDSKVYFKKVMENYRGDSWADFMGTSTMFIEWLGYPFIKYLSFTYEAMMVLFSIFGFLGFVFFYIFFRENLRYKHTFRGFDLVHLFFLLPNLHFWTSSFGKGSVIFCGLGLYFFGIVKLQSRWPVVLIGGLIIYFVRPHILLVILVSSIIGFMFSTKQISIAVRIVFLTLACIAFFYIYRDVLTMVGIDEDELLTEGFDLSHRATQLSKATSGIDIQNYNFGQKLFAFLYRPLFFDAPGFLGFVISFENVFYLLITFRLFTFSAVRYLFTSDLFVKTAFLSFITVSIALAQISGNLGLAMRQKSQVMLLLLFVIIKWMDEQKFARHRQWWLRKKRRESAVVKTPDALAT